ncbi:MAG TPA: hypothetical protein VMU49_10220 [Candidatus Acidoferrales bacterium]|nr:hypothetical protein [Candidatus Acidoferrales bacterium]
MILIIVLILLIILLGGGGFIVGPGLWGLLVIGLIIWAVYFVFSRRRA